MKQLALENASFRYLEQGFKEWLDILGYAPKTITSLPVHVREMLYYFENHGISHVNQVRGPLVKEYYRQLKERPKITGPGALSNYSLNYHLKSIRRFLDYLREVGRVELPYPNMHGETVGSKIKLLTVEEVQQLIAATYKDRPNLKRRPPSEAALQGRDRAMIAIFYGCGARRNEGINLDVSDINFDTGILHIRKAKLRRERFVPISKASLNYLQAYVYDHRPELAKGNPTDALFISNQGSYVKGSRMNGDSLINRLKILQELTGNEQLQEKDLDLHTLRHSIATHLLANGMKIDRVSRFLGHTSLESTQIYTHIVGIDPKPDKKHFYPYAKVHEDEHEPVH